MKKGIEKTQIITLMAFDTVGEAEVYHALLESAGITSIVENDLLAGMLPTGGGLLKVRININKDDEARAREVLAAKFDREEYAQETGGRKKK